MAKGQDLPEIKLSKEEGVSKFLIYFVYGILFCVTVAGAIAILYLLGVLVF